MAGFHTPLRLLTGPTLHETKRLNPLYRTITWFQAHQADLAVRFREHIQFSAQGQRRSQEERLRQRGIGIRLAPFKDPNEPASAKLHRGQIVSDRTNNRVRRDNSGVYHVVSPLGESWQWDVLDHVRPLVVQAQRSQQGVVNEGPLPRPSILLN
ncbi:hypothetical protein HRbin36_01481 [bacterium HR36]|nr:hypothetical protein HRbin36_01481 [bacterium HR36]